VIFVEENGEGSGVGRRKVAPAAIQSDASLDYQIAKQEAAIAEIPEHSEPSLEAAIAKWIRPWPKMT
jgi:hypothetical protein